MRSWADSSSLVVTQSIVMCSHDGYEKILLYVQQEISQTDFST